MKFICEVPNSTVDEILTLNEILGYIIRDKNEVPNFTKQLFKFWRITAHQGPLRTSDKDYKGSTFNVLVKCETGETTYKPLDLIASDDPVTCAEYSKRHSLLEIPVWKRFRRYSKKEKEMHRIVNQAKIEHFRRDPFWKIGILEPRTHLQALELDKTNGNTKWHEAEELEMKQVFEYNTFVDQGKDGNAPAGYKKIRCHMIMTSNMIVDIRLDLLLVDT
jgi:hypothetical protein